MMAIGLNPAMYWPLSLLASDWFYFIRLPFVALSSVLPSFIHVMTHTFLFFSFAYASLLFPLI